MKPGNGIYMFGGVMKKYYINRSSRAYLNAQKIHHLKIGVFTSVEDYLTGMCEEDEFHDFLRRVCDQVKEDVDGLNSFDLILYEEMIKGEKKKLKGQGHELASKMLEIMDEELVHRYLLEVAYSWGHRPIHLKDLHFPVLDEYNHYMDYIDANEHKFAHAFLNHVTTHFHDDYLIKLKPEHICLVYQCLEEIDLTSGYGCYFFEQLRLLVKATMIEDWHYVRNLFFDSFLLRS